jgi:hypothetical protein
VQAAARTAATIFRLYTIIASQHDRSAFLPVRFLNVR